MVEERAEHERRRASHRPGGDDPGVVEPDVPLAEAEERVEAGVVGRRHEDDVRLADERQVRHDQPLEIALAEIARLEPRRQQHAVDRGIVRLGEDAVGHRGRHALVGDQDHRRDRLAHVRGVRLDRLLRGAADDRTATCGQRPLLVLLALLHCPPRRRADGEPVLDVDAGGVDDERQIAAVEREVARRQRREIAAGGVERDPPAAGPGLHPGVGGALLGGGPEPEPADETRGHASRLEERRERPGPTETRPAPRREHGDCVLRAGRIGRRDEGGGVLVERPDHLVEARGAADDLLRPPPHLGGVALHARRRRECRLALGRTGQRGDRVGGDRRRRRLDDADREVVRHRGRARTLGGPLGALIRRHDALAELEARRRDAPPEDVLAAVGERHQHPDAHRTLRRGHAEREPDLPVSERGARRRRSPRGLFRTREHLRVVARVHRLARQRPRGHRREHDDEDGRPRDANRAH